MSSLHLAFVGLGASRHGNQQRGEVDGLGHWWSFGSNGRNGDRTIDDKNPGL
jgi:hypothetical protein